MLREHFVQTHQRVSSDIISLERVYVVCWCMLHLLFLSVLKHIEFEKKTLHRSGTNVNLGEQLWFTITCAPHVSAFRLCSTCPATAERHCAHRTAFAEHKLSEAHGAQPTPRSELNGIIMQAKLYQNAATHPRVG